MDCSTYLAYCPLCSICMVQKMVIGANIDVVVQFKGLVKDSRLILHLISIDRQMICEYNMVYRKNSVHIGATDFMKQLYLLLQAYLLANFEFRNTDIKKLRPPLQRVCNLQGLAVTFGARNFQRLGAHYNLPQILAHVIISICQSKL